MAIARPLGQHWTFGHNIGPAVPVAVAPAKGGFAGGIPLALLCLGLILLAIAATIILSLIPLYTKRRDLTANCDSDPIATTFNVDGGVLPNGDLSTNNRAALQTGLNNFLRNQDGFQRCSLVLRGATVSDCPSTRRLSRSSKTRRAEDILIRRRRQSNPNCVSQQLTTSSALNCNCNCVGACLRRKVDRLNSLLRTVIVPIVFPDGSVSTRIVGIDVPLTPTTTTSTSSTTSSTSTETAVIG